MQRQPNLLFVFGDQWRGSSVGYAGVEPVNTPRLDALARESVRFDTAVSNVPVCTPARATLLTGQYPHRHGLFLNDAHLADGIPTVAHQLNAAEYHTAWIGKWHVNGFGRARAIPPEHDKGFQLFHARECNHGYHKGFYHDRDGKRVDWPGYEPIAQTDDAINYMRERHGSGQPFALFLSWGPPHNPYRDVPQRYLEPYDQGDWPLPADVPAEHAEQARKDLAGYYAHCTALDEQMGRLLDALDELGIADHTIVVFTSDHGDMLESLGEHRKQRPYDKSILVPLLIRYPARHGREGRRIASPIGLVDLPPTLLSLCDAPPLPLAQGHDFSPFLDGDVDAPPHDASLIACYTPFSEWRQEIGGREYRGLRTERYSYVRSLDGPWLLFDSATDPLQQHNLVNEPDLKPVRDDLDARLTALLTRVNDPFRPGPEMAHQWGYTLDAEGALPYFP